MSTPGLPRRHAGFVRITHWLTTLAFLALLVSGVEVLLSHPRFYWGETGNVNESPLFTLPVPASRSTVPTGYDYVLPDQNGWSRYLHFQSAWVLGLTGLAYLLGGFASGHLRRNLVPAAAELRWPAVRRAIGEHLQLSRASAARPVVVQFAAAHRLPGRDLRARPARHLDGAGDGSGVHRHLSPPR